MTDFKYVIYFPDPYGVGKSKYFVASGQTDAELIQGESLVDEGPIITYDVPTLVDDLRVSGHALPGEIIDLCDALKLNVGISRADGGEKVWSFWRHIKGHFDSLADWKSFYELQTLRESMPGEVELKELATRTARALRSLWSKTISELNRLGEAERFFHVENPVAQIFYARQHSGIAIDQDMVAAYMQSASNEKYTRYGAVSDVLKASATGLTYWNIASRLENTDLKFIGNEASGYVLRDRMRMAANTSSFASDFTGYLDASRDLEVLSRLSDGADRAFPTVHSLGTISGRILLADPYMQELRRKYRSIVKADEGNVLRYFDFSQFEPGIMASLSKDAELINLYNQGDVYLALSKALFESEDQRDLCKRIFLSFSYGMTPKGIAALVASKKDDDQKSVVEGKISAFFSRFQTLLEFKVELEGKLLSEGGVNTLLGNRRRRVHSGPLSPKERRWAVSQVVQGTASLVFKRALLNVANVFGRDAVVVPMHDAILMQIRDEENKESIEMRVILEMKQAFAFYCPGVLARVTCGSFDK